MQTNFNADALDCPATRYTLSVYAYNLGFHV